MAGVDDEFKKQIKSSKTKFKDKNFHGAIAYLDEEINTKPADKNRLADAYSLRGFMKNTLGDHDGATADYDESIENYDKAVILNPENAVAWYYRGSTKSLLEYNELAIADFDKAIDLEPKFTIAWNSRGNAKHLLGRHEEAIADFDEAISLNPKFAFAWNNRGNAKRLLGRHAEAIADYTKAIRLDPEFADARKNHDSLKSQLEDTDRDTNTNPLFWVLAGTALVLLLTR